MIGKRLFLTALLLAPLGAGVAWADDMTIMVEKPWARATAGAGTSGAVYLTITDHGAPDRLIGVSTPAASMAMIHESYMDAGVSKMRMLDGIDLPPHKPVVFHPGSYHIMLEGLKAPLKVGSSFPLTLTFAKAPPQTVTVTVMKVGAEGPAMGDMPGMKMN